MTAWGTNFQFKGKFFEGKTTLQKASGLDTKDKSKEKCTGSLNLVEFDLTDFDLGDFNLSSFQATHQMYVLDFPLVETVEDELKDWLPPAPSIGDMDLVENQFLKTQISSN